uniref:GON domain-containing protein n=1 Tax=Plectus sambesii TaxID=2011161 RepID=A0A914VDU1_9BILA
MSIVITNESKPFEILQCSVTCGRGVRTRAVTCHRGRRHKASDSECAAVPKPQETAKCQMMTCPAYHWTVGPWSKCSEVCQQGRQVRRVSCVSNLNQRAAPRMCEGGEPQPPTSRDCISAMCPYQWVPGPWSTCSKSCGKGYRYRRLDCRVKKSLNQSSDGAQPHVPARMCHALPRPAVSKECAMSDCNADYHWSVGPWTPCSTTCGTGFRKRRVRCLNRAGDRASKHDCNVTERPHRRQSCFLRNCLPGDCAELVASDPTSTPADGIYTVLVAGFQVSVYCHLMNETHPKTFINVEKTRNFAEIYGKRLLYPFTCPHNGERNDSCECSPDISPTAGLTRFEKVRVDFHNMKININDMTFATTEYGVDVPYGVAGDCYSAVDCPQGRFSIDLRGTGLRIADQVRWTDRGHRTSSRIERAANNALVLGRCGGYCGECNPDKWRGLVLEVDQKQRPSVGAG